MEEFIFWDSSSSSDEEEIPRKYWVRPYYEDRDDEGAYNVIFKRLRNDPDLFYCYMRMDATKFEALHNMVGPIICKLWTIRQPISSECRLAITLRYLATGESQRSISISYKCSPSVVHNIIKETCKAIAEVLKPKVFPKQTLATYMEVAQGFEDRCQFPHCCGAIDGKHVQIEAPANSGSIFYNYKKTFSIVLLGICDANYRFVAAEVGAAGRESDNGVFNRSEFGKLYFSKKLPFPPPADINEKFLKMPYVFVGDDAFQLETNLMKPFSNKTLDEEEAIFNYRLSRTRRMIENTFGALAANWRIFRVPIKANVEVVYDIVSACVCLHNWLRNLKCNQYFNPKLVDSEINGKLQEGSWRSYSSNFIDLPPDQNRNTYKEAKDTRIKFMQYFNTDGSVPWQWDVVNARRQID